MIASALLLFRFNKLGKILLVPSLCVLKKYCCWYFLRNKKCWERSPTTHQTPAPTLSSCHQPWHFARINYKYSDFILKYSWISIRIRRKYWDKYPISNSTINIWCKSSKNSYLCLWHHSQKIDCLILDV